MSEQQEKESSDPEQLLNAEKKRSEEYLMRLRYLQADFENMKKRFERQTEQIQSHCNERLIIQFLDVVDELELALKLGQCENSAKVLLEGVQMTLKKLRKILEQEGVLPIESEGKVFDPTLHNAVAAVERNDVDDCIIVEEVRKGYTMKGKVIRPSIVKVAVNRSESQGESKKNE